VLPILRPTANHIHLALTASQADPWAKRVWWDWLGSWVFVGGPFGRWTVGTILGVRILKAKLHNSDQHFPGSIVEQPHLRIIVVAGFGSVLCIFAMGLAVLVSWNSLRGQTSLDTYRPPRQRSKLNKPYDTLVCIPDQIGIAHSQSGLQTDTPCIANVYHVFPGERLYDLGWYRNLKQVESQFLFCDNALHKSDLYAWPKLNPSVLSRIRGEQPAQRTGDRASES